MLLRHFHRETPLCPAPLCPAPAPPPAPALPPPHPRIQRLSRPLPPLPPRGGGCCEQPVRVRGAAPQRPRGRRRLQS